MGADQPRVFDAIAADASTWTSWFPGLSAGASSGVGLGSTRWVKVSGATYRETIVVFDPPRAWAFRVDEMTVPMANALVELWTTEGADNGTTVAWTFAVDPKAWFGRLLPVASRLMQRLFERAMTNLDNELRSR